jgi:hypothetical protein
MEGVSNWAALPASVMVFLLLMRYPQIVDWVFGKRKKAEAAEDVVVHRQECHSAMGHLERVLRTGLDDIRAEVKEVRSDVKEVHIRVDDVLREMVRGAKG